MTLSYKRSIQESGRILIAEKGHYGNERAMRDDTESDRRRGRDYTPLRIYSSRPKSMSIRWSWGVHTAHLTKASVEW